MERKRKASSEYSWDSTSIEESDHLEFEDCNFSPDQLSSGFEDWNEEGAIHLNKSPNFRYMTSMENEKEDGSSGSPPWQLKKRKEFFSEESEQDENTISSFEDEFVDNDFLDDYSTTVINPIGDDKKEGDIFLYSKEKEEGTRYLKESFGKKHLNRRESQRRNQPIVFSDPLMRSLSNDDHLFTTTTSTTVVTPEENSKTTTPHSLYHKDHKMDSKHSPPQNEQQEKVVNLVTPEKKKKKSFHKKRSNYKQAKVESDSIVPDCPNSKQILDDEAFARRLEENFNHPAPQIKQAESQGHRFSTEDTDAMLAYQLEMEERKSRAPRFFNRHTVMPSTRSFNPIGNFSGLASFLSYHAFPSNLQNSWLPQLFGFRGGVSSANNRDRQLNLLHLSLTNRDFNENDYEMLLQLDDTVSKGADANMITSLPTYNLEKMEIVKTCCICLLDMEEGTTVKKLPCSHFFHKECIDQWLQVNKVCPIDKKRIDEF